MRRQPQTPNEVKTPPHNDDLERTVLGSSLASKTYLRQVVGQLTPHDFYFEASQLLWAAICACYERDPDGVDCALVDGELQRRDQLHDERAAGWLTSLTNWSETPSKAPAHLREMKNLSALREAQRIAGGIYSDAENRPADVAAFLTDAVTRLTDLAERSAPRIAFTTFSEVGAGMAETTWLWQDWIPNGYITLMAGDPGVGKSMFALDLARSVAQPDTWPDGSDGPEEPATVLYCDTEAAQAMHVQRARAWGVPMDRLLLPGADGTGHLWLDEPESLLAVRQAVIQHGVRLVIVDSLRAGFKGDENSSEVAEMMTQWAGLARDLDIAMVFIHHFRKRQQGEKREAALDTLRGSSAIGAAARSVIALDCPDPRDTAVRAAVVKTNLCPKPPAIGLQVSEDGITPTGAPHKPRPDTKLADAEDFLIDQLCKGAKSPSDLMELAEAQGIKRPTLYRAKESLNLVSLDHPDDPRKAMWGMPARRIG